MGISLQKGQKIDLTKTNPGLKNIFVGLGWDTKKYDGGHDFDLDTQAVLIGDDGKVVNKKTSIIFYNNLKNESGAIQHLGDNLTGEGEGDDEQIKINLSMVPENVQKIAFTVTIHEFDIRQQNFGQVSNAFIRIVNEESNEELIRYDLSEDFSIETAVVVGELYRHENEWKFNAIGSGLQNGLKGVCDNFGAKLD
jgi:tellurium resistance protein TerD